MTAQNINDNVISEVIRLAGNPPTDQKLENTHILGFAKGDTSFVNIARTYMAKPLTKLINQAFTQFLAELKAVGSAA